MKIKIVGGSKAKQAMVLLACEFYANLLMSKRLGRVVDLEIHFLKNMIKKSGANGMCEWLDRNDRPRSFIIILDAGMDMQDTVQVLAHEMVHLKQSSTGEMTRLEHVEPWLLRWHGRRINFAGVGYKDWPWEIEACDREKGLAEQFWDERLAEI